MKKECSKILIEKGNTWENNYIGDFTGEELIIAGFETPHLFMAKTMIENVVAECIEKEIGFELKISEKFCEEEWNTLFSSVVNTFEDHGIDTSNLL